MNTRPYVQTRRAESAAATHARIIDAAIALFLEHGTIPTLDAVAARAGVTVQTVIRRFGSKEGVHQAAAEQVGGQVAAARDQAPVGDVEGAIANLVEHYAQWADLSLRLQEIEPTSPAAAQRTAEARGLHHRWVERVFAPFLDRLDPAARPRRLVELVTVTDVYVWKVLRRDLGLPREEVEATLVDLVHRILA